MHLLPGRLRLKSTLLKGDHQNAQFLESSLGRVKGVQKASVNTITGSLTVFFDQKLTSAHAILNFLIKENWVENILPFPRKEASLQLISNPAITKVPLQFQWKGQSLEFRTNTFHSLNSQVMGKIAATTVKIVLPLLIERYIGKSASKFVSLVL